MTHMTRVEARAGNPSWLNLKNLTGSKMFVGLVLLLIWQFGVRLFDINPNVLPTPVEIATAGAADLLSGRLLVATWITLKLLLIAVSISFAIAIVLTVLGTLTSFGRALMNLLTTVLNPLPGIAMLPLALLWFGYGTNSLLFVVINSGVWVLTLNFYRGFEMVPLTLRRVGQNFGMKGWELVKDVYFYSALPYILTGLKVGWAFGWRTIIAAEMVYGASGTEGGLGWFIYLSQYNIATASVFAGLLMIIVVGLLVERFGFETVETATIRKWGMTV